MVSLQIIARAVKDGNTTRILLHLSLPQEETVEVVNYAERVIKRFDKFTNGDIGVGLPKRVYFLKCLIRSKRVVLQILLR